MTKQRRIVGGLIPAALMLVSMAAPMLASCSRSEPRPEPHPTRIVLIVVDTLRRDHVSAYGGTVATPNVDRLAADGQLFTNAISSFHQTTMSMASMFTGRTPSIESVTRKLPLHWNGRTWCGLARFAPQTDEASCVPRSLPTMAERMGDAGYHTIGIASNELLFRPAGFERGFDEWFEIGTPLSDSVVDYKAAERARAARYVNQKVRDALDARPDGATFLYVHYMDAHDWDLHGSYTEAVGALDVGIGRLLDDLAEQSFLDDAVVVLTADHGESLGERHPVPVQLGHLGNPSYEQVLQVPLIVMPAVLENSSRLVRSQDIADLLLEIAGIESTSIGDLDSDELYLSEVAYQTYRRGRWKSTVSRKDERFLLFDLEADPGETQDVATWNPTVAREHMRRIGELAKSLATTEAPPAVLSEADAQRLRQLGYLE